MMRALREPKAAIKAKRVEGRDKCITAEETGMELDDEKKAEKTESPEAH